MIPKVIHYCWFGRNPLPKLAIKCIESWRRFLPDYEIKEWNENNFDVFTIPYTAEAYKTGKYAFVSDYARFWILYHYGGLYFDTDVEIIKSLDDIIDKGPFMGCERDAVEGATTPEVAPGLGVNPGLGLYKEILDFYENAEFVFEKDNRRMLTVVEIVTKILVNSGLKMTNDIQYVKGVYIYPSEYFCPIDTVTKRLNISDNTRTVHHYAASWTNMTFERKLKSWIRPLLPSSFLYWYNKNKI